MDILVACETSGMVREALRRRGHNAISVDLLPSKDDSPYHITADMRCAVERQHWDGMVFHPDCTYLTCSAEWAYADPDFERYPGVGYHQRVKPGTLTGAARRAARKAALAFFMYGYNLPIKRVVVENPVGVVSSYFRKPCITVQPFQFSDDASKRTCFWTRGVPKLIIPPRVLWHPGRIVDLPNGKSVRRWANQTDSGQNRLSPGSDRWDLRSATYPGVAEAIADLFTPLNQPQQKESQNG